MLSLGTSDFFLLCTPDKVETRIVFTLDEKLLMENKLSRNDGETKLKSSEFGVVISKESD
jgi:hypothetical protein